MLVAISILNSKYSSQQERKRATEEILTHLHSNIPDGEREKILKAVISMGKSLSGDFRPVIAGLLFTQFFKGDHKKFASALRSGNVRIGGKKILIANLDSLEFLCRGRAMWHLYGEWLSVKSPVQFHELLLIDPASTLDRDSLQDYFDLLTRKLQTWQKDRASDPDWGEKIVRAIYPCMIPSLIIQGGWCSSLRLWDWALRKASGTITQDSLWEKIVRRSLTIAVDISFLRKLWNRYPTIPLAKTIVRKWRFKLIVLKEIISTILHDKRIALKSSRDRRKTARWLVEKWCESNPPSLKVLRWMAESTVTSVKLFRKGVRAMVWDLRVLDSLIRRAKNSRFREILTSRRRFLRFLKRKNIPVRIRTIREGILKRFTDRKVAGLIRLVSRKKKYYRAGSVVSTFRPLNNSHQSMDNDCPSPTPGSIFTFFLALISRDNRELIERGAEIVGDPVLMKRARDSLSMQERVDLFIWAKECVVDGKNLWDQITAGRSRNKEEIKKVEELLLNHLKGYCGEKRAILLSLRRIIPSSMQSPKKEKLILRIGGCSLDELNIPSSDVACCYFRGGGYDDNLIPWIIARNHFFFYFQMVKKRRRRYVGVAMLFFADQCKTLVVDSVEGKTGTFRNYPGWQEWLITVLKEYGRRFEVNRIVINKRVNGDLAVKFVKWIEENESPEKNPESVKLRHSVKKVPMEFNPIESHCISLPLQKNIQ